jgi:hypothetical protein
MIKFEHSIFALPFALTAAVLAVYDAPLPWGELAWKLFWIISAMVSARSAAMAFNRVIDADIDAQNPRTQTRAIPAGLVSKAFTWGFILVWSALFVLAAAMLNRLCLLLSPVALAVVFGDGVEHQGLGPQRGLGGPTDSRILSSHGSSTIPSVFASSGFSIRWIRVRAACLPSS